MVIADKKVLRRQGDLVVTGRLVDASNATLFATVTYNGHSMDCIYKPIAGERPLWDFADGALAHREYAAYLISDHLGFDLVPLTLLRPGPFGEGMVQEWIDIDESIDLAEFFATNNPELRSMALFDAIINNTDRKIGHLLPTSDGRLFGCDHGVTFHSQDKLRTVLWQWAGVPLSGAEIELLDRAEVAVAKEIDLRPFLTGEEISALLIRIQKLLAQKIMPVPSPDWPAVPWPAF